MAPKDVYEFIIIRLVHVPHIDPQNPKITLSKKTFSPNNSTPYIRDWFERVLDLEKSLLPRNSHVRYLEWKIMTAEWELFRLDGFQFNKLFILIGEHTSHWAYYQNIPYQRRLESSGHLGISFCGCCIKVQFHKIVKAIRHKTRRNSRRNC